MGPETTSFDDMLFQVRSGVPSAIQLFVSIYEPFIRRTVRFRLARSDLRVVADSVDVCQSVFASFLIRFTAGQYELQTEDDLRKLLSSIARHKFLALQRRELAEKRDRRVTVSIENMEELIDSRQINPVRTLSHDEIMTEFASRLSDDERTLFDSRRSGLSWSTIAAELRVDDVVLRKRLSRAVRRVALEMGIEE